MKRTWIDYLTDILDSIKDIESFVNDITCEQFIDDHLRRNAVVRSLEVIGEAAKKIPDTLRERYSDIPWKRMAGMRDKLIHGYFGVDWASVWETATIRIPEIQSLIEKMLQEESDKEKL
ncbi:MAG TPA: DUF86 domain-containing protein [Spirochaetota bacterium]|nr:DUF86 domain-containing protein [Spirochaetota bacterium]